MSETKITGLTPDQFPILWEIAEELLLIMDQSEADNFVAMEMACDGKPCLNLIVSRVDGESVAVQMTRYKKENDALRVRVLMLEQALCSITQLEHIMTPGDSCYGVVTEHDLD